MRFLLTCLWVWLIILRLSPTHYHDPSMTTITGESPDTIRFASHALLDSYWVVVVDWKRSNKLRLQTRAVYRVHPQRLYRVHRPAAVIVTLLLASGDVESNPGPVQYPCTVCEKPVKVMWQWNSIFFVLHIFGFLVLCRSRKIFFLIFPPLREW